MANQVTNREDDEGSVLERVIVMAFEVHKAFTITHEQLHEALCKAIHEGDPSDLIQLGKDIVDIK
jgi:hypothetical protein